MHRTTASSTARAVPERFAWALWLLLGIAVAYAGISIFTLVRDLSGLVGAVQPGARVPVVLDVSYELPTNGGTNDYGGGPFVRDGTPVFATQIATTLDNIPEFNRVAISAAPVLWDITSFLVAIAILIAASRLLRGVAFGRDASRPMVVAAIALALGSTLAQLLQGASSIAFGVFSWAAPSGADNTISRVNGFTFDFTPFAVACCMLVIALVLRRGVALRRDVDGLV